MSETTKTHTKTMPASQVEPWLDSLVRTGGTIIGMTQSGAPGGKVKVTATVATRH